MKRNLIKTNSRQSQERLGKNIGGRGDYGGQNERAKDDKFSSFFQCLSLYQPRQGKGGHKEGHIKDDSERKNHEEHKFQIAFHGKKRREVLSSEGHEEMKALGHDKEIGKSNASKEKCHREGDEENGPGPFPVRHGRQDKTPELEENYRRRQDETGDYCRLHINDKDLRRPGKVKMARRCRKN